MHSDDKNGDKVDVRIFVLGLKPITDYFVIVKADHNPRTSLVSKADFEGLFWAVVKIPMGNGAVF